MTTETLPVDYRIQDAAIAEMRDRLLPTVTAIAEQGGYDLVRTGIKECRDLRLNVEDRRKELKAASIEYGKRVDSEAKRITALLLEIEEPLKSAKQAVDDEKERIKKEKEAEALRFVEEKIRQAREAEEAVLRQAREVEEARQKAEAERLAAERAQLEAERTVQAEAAAKLAKIEAVAKAEREKIEAEWRAIEEQRRQLERAEFERYAAELERQAKIQAEREAQAQVERDLHRAEHKAKLKAEADAQEAARLAELRPDAAKINEFGRMLLAITPPQVTTAEAKRVVDVAKSNLQKLGTELSMFPVSF